MGLSWCICLLSIYDILAQDFYTLSDFTDVPKADVHVHIRTDRDAFAKQAQIDEFQLVNIVVDGAGTWQGVKEQFHYAIFQQREHPDIFRTITAFSVEDFLDSDWVDRCKVWMDSCFEQGALGVKVWKNIGMVLKDRDGQNVMLDDLRFDPLFDHIIAQERMVVGHLGEPLNCWLPLEEMTTNNDKNYFRNHPEYHMYRHPELPSYKDQMEARDRRLDKHPNLVFMGAHMASIEWNVDTLAQWLDRYPNATIDLAARMGQVFYQAKQDWERVRQFFVKYADRIMYATDMGDRGSDEAEQLRKKVHETWMRDWQFFTTNQEMESDLIDGHFKGIHLPKEAVDQIYYKTAKRIFGF